MSEPTASTMDANGRWDGLLLDARLATLRDDLGAYGAIEDGALGWKDGRIVFAGPRTDLEDAPEQLATHVASAEGRWVTPGLIDCHTHLVFAGTRAAEFEQRLQGASYEQIARAGGGIVSTVRATRAASEDRAVANRCRGAGAAADGVPRSRSSRDTASTRPERACSPWRARLGARSDYGATTLLGAHACPGIRRLADDYREGVR